VDVVIRDVSGCIDSARRSMKQNDPVIIAAAEAKVPAPERGASLPGG
jgi:hypothetical protein